MEEFPSNSKQPSGKNKEPKVIKKVVTGEVVQKRKPLGRRFKEVFFGGDFKSAARYIAADVLLPALRNLIVDASSKGVERMIYGESMQRRRPLDNRPRVQYNSPVFRGNRDPRERGVSIPNQQLLTRRSSNPVDDIIVTSKEEADLVVSTLIEVIDVYDVASLADLYDLLGLPNSHVDQKWGWYSLNGAAVSQVRDGYLIELPQPEPI